jgi:hypothetical protein
MNHGREDHLGVGSSVVVKTFHDDCWRSHVRDGQHADTPGYQRPAPHESRVLQTSPAVAHELALTTADENSYFQ